MKKIILASQSPRRKQLLEWAEVDFEIYVKETDESFPADMHVTDVPVHIARNKALVVKNDLNSGHLIIAADTVVVLDNEIIGKPKDREEAVNILTRLSGRTHSVVTGVCLMGGEKEYVFADSTSVTFHELTKEQLEYYVDHYKPYDKAGAYAIQEWIGVVGIRSVQGDFYNVMGLPVSRVIQEMKRFV
jgi:septum formation protein